MAKNALMIAIGKGPAPKGKGLPSDDEDDDTRDMGDHDAHDDDDATDEEKDLAQTLIDSKDAGEFATALKHFITLVYSQEDGDDEGDDE